MDQKVKSECDIVLGIQSKEKVYSEKRIQWWAHDFTQGEPITIGDPYILQTFWKIMKLKKF